ncbi:uncharacterized protein LOC110843784 isoform X2 [Folsomia candida]|uniref:uncharacterized protein LOC110843784 isoform X2 n=1 Tax=Folsomia candida TaxID=158441 RepID=UPI000B904AD7|nr:uncharacterized protein LOC110843784 isoform X2 [Folsomia candida]
MEIRQVYNRKQHIHECLYHRQQVLSSVNVNRCHPEKWRHYQRTQLRIDHIIRNMIRHPAKQLKSKSSTQTRTFESLKHKFNQTLTAYTTPHQSKNSNHSGLHNCRTPMLQLHQIFYFLVKAMDPLQDHEGEKRELFPRKMTKFFMCTHIQLILWICIPNLLQQPKNLKIHDLQLKPCFLHRLLQERTTDINGVERSDNVNEIIISEKITTKPSNITTATHPQLSPPSKSDSNNSSPLTSQTPTLISPTIATQIIHQFPSPVQIPSYSYQFQRKGDLLHSPWDNRITQTPVPVFDRDASQPGFFSPFLAKFIDFEVNQQESAEFLRKILFAFAIGTLIAAWIALGVALGVFPLHLLFSNEEKTRSNSELKRNVLNGSDLDELGQRVSLALDSMWLKALEDRVKKDPEGDFTVAKCCILSNLKKVDCVLVRNNKESGKVGGGPVSCASGLVYNFQFGEDDQDENDDVLT